MLVAGEPLRRSEVVFALSELLSVMVLMTLSSFLNTGFIGAGDFNPITGLDEA